MNKPIGLTPNQQHQELATGSNLPATQSPYQMVLASSQARSMNNCSDEEIKNAYKYVMVLLGLSKDDLPDELEKAVLIEFTRSFWGVKFSPDDIINAFKLALAGILTDNEGKEIDTSLYGKRFSVQFVKRFMYPYEAYQRHVLKRFAQLEKLKMQVKAEEEKRGIADLTKVDEQIYEHVIDYIRKNKEIPPVWPVDICYKVISSRFDLHCDQDHLAKIKELAMQEIMRKIKDTKTYNSDNAELNIQKSDKLRKLQSEDQLEYEIKRQHCLHHFNCILSSPALK